MPDKLNRIGFVDFHERNGLTDAPCRRCPPPQGPASGAGQGAEQLEAVEAERQTNPAEAGGGRPRLAPLPGALEGGHPPH